MEQFTAGRYDIMRKLIFILILFGLIGSANAQILFSESFLFSSSGSATSGNVGSGGSIAFPAASVTTCQGCIESLIWNFTLYKQPRSARVTGNIDLFSGTQFQILNNTNGTGIQAKMTYFDATVGGIYLGSGQIGWQRIGATNTIQYYVEFSSLDTAYANTLTGQKQINFTYDMDIFQNYLVGYAGGGTMDASSNTGSSVGFMWIGTHAGTKRDYTVNGCSCNVFEFSVSDTINYTYNNISSTFGYLNVTKGNANAIVTITNYSYAELFNQTSTTDVSYFTSVSNGLRLFIVDVAAVSSVNRTLFDASGNINQQITPGNNTGGSTTGQIYYDYSQARITFPYGINTSISDSNYTLKFRSFRIRVWHNCLGTVCTEEIGSPIDFSNQTYNTSRLWNFNAFGTYYSQLYYSEPWEVGLFYHLMDTASIVINQQAFAYNITSDQTNYSDGDTIRLLISNPSPTQIYLNMFLQAGGQNLIIDQPVAANSTSYVNFTVTSSMLFGTWEAGLYTKPLSDGKVASTTFTVGVPLANTGKQGLRWGDRFLFGETNTLYYTAGWNASTIRVYKQVPGTNTTVLDDNFSVTGNATGSKGYLLDVVGTWSASITDNNNASNLTWANFTVQNNQTLVCNKQLKSWVCWDQQSYTRGSSFIISYKIDLEVLKFANSAINKYMYLTIYDPEGTLIINKTIANGNSEVYTSSLYSSYSGTFSSFAKTGRWKTSTIWGGSPPTFDQSLTIAEGYAFILSDSNTSNGDINDKGVLTGDCLAGSPVCMVDGWVGLMGMGINDISRFLFACIITIILACVGGIIIRDSRATGAILVGFIPFAWFAYISFFPAWFVVLLILMIVAKLRWF